MTENKRQTFFINDSKEAKESCEAIKNNSPQFPKRPDMNLVTSGNLNTEKDKKSDK